MEMQVRKAARHGELAWRSAPRGLPTRQRGAVLVIGVILLLIITLFALASLRSILTQERIAGGLYDREVAFDAAESALRYVERELLKTDGSKGSVSSDIASTDYTGGDDYKFFAVTHADEDFDTLISSIGGAAYGYSLGEFTTDQATAHSSPHYTIVKLTNSGDCGEAYKINAIGVGRNVNTVTVLQSVVCRNE